MAMMPWVVIYRMCVMGLILLPSACIGQDAQLRSSDRQEYRITRVLSEKAKEKVEVRIRHFLWSHFKSQRRGSLKVTWFTLEGDGNIYRYEIQPNNKGQWVIKLAVERYWYPPGPPESSQRHTTRENYMVYDIKILSPSGNILDQVPDSPHLVFFKTHPVELLQEDGKSVQRI